MFFRVWVYARSGKNAKVFFLDWGNSAAVPVSSLRGLPEEFWKIKPFAVPFFLAGKLHAEIPTYDPLLET